MSLVAKRRGADTWQVLLPELLKTAGSGPAATEMVGHLFCSGSGLLQLCLVHWQPIIDTQVQTASRESCVPFFPHPQIALHFLEKDPPYSASLAPA